MTNLNELSNHELTERFELYAREQIPRGAKITKISHATKDNNIACTYSLNNKQYFLNIKIPDRLM